MIRIERNGEIATVVLDRPAKRNALDKDMWDGLLDAGKALQAEPPRVVILSGEGEHFCSGMDLSPTNPLLNQVAQLIPSGDIDKLSDVIRHLKSCFLAIAEIPAPVICAIEGICMGGALELALHTDIRIAGEGSIFSMPETRWGMVPDVGGTARLGKTIGHARATQMILSGEKIDADRAERWGLVNEVVPSGTARERAEGLAGSILKGSPNANREALLARRRMFAMGDGERAELETAAGAAALVSGDVMKGMTAFMMKTDPQW